MDFRFITLALAGLTALSQANAQTQAHVTLDNLTVTLRDLNAADGRAASFAWDGKWRVSSGFLAWSQTAWTMQPNGPGSTAYEAEWGFVGGHSDYGPPEPILSSSYSRQGDYSQASVMAQADGNGELDHLTMQNSILSGKSAVVDAYPNRTFVLGPGSAVDISVTLTGGVSIAAATPATPVGGHITYPQSQSEIYVALAQRSMRGVEFSRRVVNDTFHHTDAVSASFDHELLTSTFSNLSSEPVSIVLLVRMYAHTMEVTPVVASVPEPAAWALMSTGLLAVGAAARRRRV